MVCENRVPQSFVSALRLSLLVVLFGVVGSGCGTVRGLDESWPEPEFYLGVRTDCADIVTGGVGALSLVDLPLSLVADTILVPVHGVLWARSQLLTPPHDGTQFQLNKTE